MKALVYVALLGVAIIAGYFVLTGEMAEEQGPLVGVAFGLPENDTIEVHLVVSGSMVRVDPPRMDLRGNILWDEWVEQHFQLRDEAGQPIKLIKQNASAVIPDHKAGGTPEFYLFARIKQSTKHNLSYRQVLSEGKAYQFDFTAPQEATDIRRVAFKVGSIER